MSCLTFDITTDSIFADMPIVRHKIYHFDDGKKLFTASLGSGIDFLVMSTNSRDLSEEFYSRKIWLFDKELSVVYLNFLKFVFHRVDDCTYNVSRVTGDGTRDLGVLEYQNGKVRFNGDVLETAKMRSLYAKCVTLM